MIVTLTAEKILAIGAWDEVCDVKGWNPWCINEGRMTSDEQVKISEYDLKKCPTIRGYLARQLND